MRSIDRLAPVLAAWDRGDMMDNGSGHWVWMVVIVLIVVVFLATLVWLVARRPPETGGGVPPTHSARQILAERLARGEITTDEYQERLRALG